MQDVDLKQTSSYAAWTTDTIRYVDLDPNNHVNNGAIGSYLEDGRVRFRSQHLAALGADILAGFVLVKFTVEYHAPLHFPGSVDIGTVVLRVGSSSYTLGQGLFREGRCAATAEVVTVRLDRATGRPAPMDERIKDALRAAGPPPV